MQWSTSCATSMVWNTFDQSLPTTLSPNTVLIETTVAIIKKITHNIILASTCNFLSIQWPDPNVGVPAMSSMATLYRDPTIPQLHLWLVNKKKIPKSNSNLQMQMPSVFNLVKTEHSTLPHYVQAMLQYSVIQVSLWTVPVAKRWSAEVHPVLKWHDLDFHLQSFLDVIQNFNAIQVETVGQWFLCIVGQQYV